VHYITKAAYLEPIFNLSGFFVRFLESACNISKQSVMIPRVPAVSASAFSSAVAASNLAARV